MNDLIERLRLGDGTSPDHKLLLEAADALEALAQPMRPEIKKMYEDYFDKCFRESSPTQQGPVAWISFGTARMIHWTADKPAYGDDWVPLYITPPQRKPLTHEQRFDLLTKFEPHQNKWEAPAILIDMVEAAHGIKGET